MRLLKEMSVVVRRNVRVVLTDIDDTLTTEGRLPAVAYAALERLHAAGVLVVPVTGRPAGWCDLIARQWPVDGVVGENGAFAFSYNDHTKRMTRNYARSAQQRTADRSKLNIIAAEVLSSVAGSAISTDQAYREADLAIDFCEDVPPLPRAEVRRIVNIFESHGAVAKVSSIHVNGWFGDYDKLTTSREFLRTAFCIDVATENSKIVYAGDPPIDAPMFGLFQNSVGVANVLDFEGQMLANPTWITPSRGADGFAELAAALLEVR